MRFRFELLVPRIHDLFVGTMKVGQHYYSTQAKQREHIPDLPIHSINLTYLTIDKTSGFLKSQSIAFVFKFSQWIRVVVELELGKGLGLGLGLH